MESAEKAMEAVLPASERTRIIEVTERIVAIGQDGNPSEASATKKVFIRPMPFRRWLKALSLVTSLLQYLPEDGLNFADKDGNPDPLAIGIVVTTMLGTAEADLIALACLATDLDEDVFDRIDLDDAVAIITAVVEVNKDFFVQKALPLIQQSLPNMEAVKDLISGPTQ